MVKQLLEETKKQSLILQEHTTKLEGINVQTTKHNGRMEKVETRVGDIEKKHDNFVTKVTTYATIGASVVTFLIHKLFP